MKCSEVEVGDHCEGCGTPIPAGQHWCSQACWGDDWIEEEDQ